MKNIILKSIRVSMVFLLMFFANSCMENTDLVTENAKTGGLIKAPKKFPFTKGGAPSFQVPLTIPEGSGITEVKIMSSYNSFVIDPVTKYVLDTLISNEVLLTTVDVAGANVGEAVSKPFTLTYATLIKDLVIEGGPMPADELELHYGDFWMLRYISVLEDGTELINLAKTTLAVANPYTGNYLCTGVFHHPTAGDRDINQEKFLTPLNSTTSYCDLGDLGASGYDIKIEVATDNSCTVSAGPNAKTAVFMSAGLPNEYLPETKEFNLSYYYVGGSGNRVIEENYLLLE